MSQLPYSPESRLTWLSSVLQLSDPRKIPSTERLLPSMWSTNLAKTGIRATYILHYTKTASSGPGFNHMHLFNLIICSNLCANDWLTIDEYWFFMPWLLDIWVRYKRKELTHFCWSVPFWKKIWTLNALYSHFQCLSE